MSRRSGPSGQKSMGYSIVFGFCCQQCYSLVMDAKFVKNMLISGVLLGLSFSLITSTLRVVQRSKRLLEVKEELKALEQQKTALEKEAEYRKSAQFIEEEARNKLNMVKPGEEVYLKPKIMGDDLLGVQSQRNNSVEPPKRPAHAKSLFDKIKEVLLLFQS